MAAARDMVIIGGGHNGLVAAYYLARGGLKPLVLERREVVGGAGITEEFHPGFRCSTLAHTDGPLSPRVRAELQLERHGLEILQPDPVVFAPSLDGRALVLRREPREASREVARFSKKDAEKYREFVSFHAGLASVLGPVMEMTPPAVDGAGAGELWNLLKVGRKFRSLGPREMFRLLRYGPMAVADLVGEWFETELLRATVAARGIFGNFLGPWSAGSGAALLLRAAQDGHPAGSANFPRGGMGALAQALASAAGAAGAEIRTGAEIAQIAVKEGVATGVVLSGGEEIAAKAVVSGADPKRTLLRLVDPVHLEPQFVVKMQHYRSRGISAKVNLALDALPSFRALAGSQAAAGPAGSPLAGRIHIGPEIDYLERAFDDAKYGDFSRQPYLDVTIPTILDPTLAPAGKHVMSIYVQFAPFQLKSGDWPSQREALADTVVKTLADYAPDLPGKIVARQVITPLDLEETYGLTGGHIFHGELALDQVFLARPLLDWARYRTPIRGLYLCGSGTHPGTGLTGASGRNAAREILKDLRR